MLDTTDERITGIAEAARSGMYLGDADAADLGDALFEAFNEVDALRAELARVKRQAEIDVAFARQQATITKLEDDRNDPDDAAWFAELRECVPRPQWLQVGGVR